MGYNLYVSGAQQFVPAFYARLIKTGDVAEATRAGRRQMLANPERLCSRGEYALQDWLVPVVYQQLTASEQVLPTPTTVAMPAEQPGPNNIPASRFTPYSALRISSNGNHTIP